MSEENKTEIKESIASKLSRLIIIGGILLLAVWGVTRVKHQAKPIEDTNTTATILTPLVDTSINLEKSDSSTTDLASVDTTKKQ